MHPSSHYSMAEFRKQVNDHINLRLQRKTDTQPRETHLSQSK